LNLLLFYPSKLTPPTIIMLFLYSSTEWKQGDSLGH